MIKVDLHLHSSASSRGAGFFSEKLQVQESYVTPRQVYDTLFERGMNLFTITDHDSIDGCLEIAHLPGAFISEEVTTYFPEDRCKIHVIALDINEEIHRELQRLRYNVYELVDYLQASGLPTIVSSIGATRENLKPGVTGYVIEDNNPFSYAEKVRELLDTPAKLSKMRQQAIEHMADKGERELLMEMVQKLSLGKVKLRAGE
ncbi:glycosyltransferase [Desulfurispira natronophila]|uniref:Putative metal-dependent phosphoesterase TrpH n=1 Tax=Desulfurispira natronophila TaxID=682562 RepID=A0A7W7Y586_9BACT|nr:glycosyltransferase [Desulfurispira natronophila]MBB5022237.1 putative metal-dependent phosphoesterase TrpH [Desulfurispira natronophila]